MNGSLFFIDFIHLMLQKIKLLIRFLHFYWNAQTSYRLHSPFIFQFAREILDDQRMFYAFPVIERLRKSLKRNRTKLTVTDHGAGSKIQNDKQRSVRQLVKYSASSPFYCQVLFKTINAYQPLNILELGTSVGISSLYQAAGLGTGGRLITLEGCPQIAQVAKENIEMVDAQNIELRVGRFEDTLVPALEELKRLDYVFIDGNHREKPTIEYFETCLQYAHEASIFVFDDIHWSEGMEAAWRYIQQHSKVTMSIDLFSCGLVFLRTQNKTKLHYQLVPTRWKPWQMGFFRAK